jgi:hypothetical protein
MEMKKFQGLDVLTRGLEAYSDPWKTLLEAFNMFFFKVIFQQQIVLLF